MKSGRLKNSITYLLLVIFLSMKMVGLHELLHNDDKHKTVHCLVCDHSITHNLTPAIATNLNDYAIVNREIIFHKKSIESYSAVPQSNNVSGQLFSRPPPTL